MGSASNTYLTHDVPLSMQQSFWERSLFPQWLSRYPVFTYFAALLTVSAVYSAYSMPWYYMLSGTVAIIAFFIYGASFTKSMSPLRMRKVRKFEKRLFLIAFVPRVALMLTLYYVFQAVYEDAFGFEAGDATYYDDLGVFVSELIEKGNFHFYDEISRWSNNEDLSDMGYGVYVGLIYFLVGHNVIVVRLIKCALSALTAVLIYRLAKRNFGEQTARMAGIFVALWANFWYYSSVHLKEVEMTFLGVLFVEQADQMLRSRNFTGWKVVPVLMIAMALFTVRTPLALVALLSMIFSVVMVSSKVVSWAKRIIVGGLAIVLMFVVAGNRIQDETRGFYETARGGQQKSNMEWRATRSNGNRFAKYAGSTVFAPLIFTLPFPTMVRPFDGQDVQQFNNGGNFVKNIMSGFTILAMFTLLLSGKWREHLLPLSFMLGYLVVLSFSSFAQSERFHQPVMPFEFMFSAYGLTVALTEKKYKRWFTYLCIIMFVAAVGWNWFKLKGRGL